MNLLLWLSTQTEKLQYGNISDLYKDQETSNWMKTQPCICPIQRPLAGYNKSQEHFEGAQWLSGRVLDSRPKGRGFEPHRRHCVVSLSKNINPSLVLVQPRKTRPFITERLLMGRKESNQTNKQIIRHFQIPDEKQTPTSSTTTPQFLY